MKVRERDGTVRDMTQAEIDAREAAHQAQLDQAQVFNNKRNDALAVLEQSGEGPPSRAEFEELKAAVKALVEIPQLNGEES